MVGQGITYNSGGIHLRDKDELQDMRGDICGAACVVAACRAIAAMRLPINLRGLIPLCEHMIGCEAVRPGDIVQSKDGRYIEVERTDHAAVLALNDALLYAKSFRPKFIVDVGTLSSEKIFGTACCAVFINSKELWSPLENAGVHTGDRLWRMPILGTMKSQYVGKQRDGDACKAAAFLNEFMRDQKWVCAYIAT